MSTTTTNYELIKPALTDAADITATNENWDKIDETLAQKFDKSGGDLTGDVVIKKAVPALKLAYDDVKKTDIFKNANSANDLGTIISDYSTDGARADIMLRANEQKLSLRLNGQTYDIYSAHRKPTASEIGAISSVGGTITGDLIFKKVDNGSASIFKNHNANNDYGLSLMDKSSTDDVAELSIVANTGELIFTANNKPYEVYHAGNKPTPEDIGAMPVAVTTAVVG